MVNTNERQECVVIGLGRFGTSLALKLVESGFDVLAIDRDRDTVQELADDIPHVLALDATDEGSLRAAGVDAFHTAVVAIGADFESNILATVLLKEIGVRRVVCKALNKRQRDILLRVGADEVVLPEHEAGERLARHFASPLLIETVELDSGLMVTEMRSPPSLAGRTLGELRFVDRYGVTVLLLRGSSVRVTPRESEVLQENDILLLVGPKEGMERLAAETG